LVVPAVLYICNISVFAWQFFLRGKTRPSRSCSHPVHGLRRGKPRLYRRIQPLDRGVLYVQGLLKFFQEKLHVFFGGQGAHYADAEDFAGEWAKAAGDFDAGAV
jgi:hypothetical protein